MSSAPPDGFLYTPEIITITEEAMLLANLRQLKFHEVRMHGVIAKRRVFHFGWDYGYESWKIEPGPPLPEFLVPLRAVAGQLAGITPEALAEVLVTEYPAGAGIGWHRDAPMFGTVVGISLLSRAELRFRPGSKGRTEFKQLLEPRSGYVLQGEVRSRWQHHIPPAKALRYSVTFRTLKA